MERAGYSGRLFCACGGRRSRLPPVLTTAALVRAGWVGCFQRG